MEVFALYRTFKFTLHQNNRISFFIHVSPAIIIVFIFLYLPFFLNIFYSFTEWNGFSKNPKFIGLENFKNIFTDDPDFKNSLLFTLKYVVFYVTSINLIALFMAVILEYLNSKSFFIAALYVPCIFSQIIVGFIWKFIFYQGFDGFYDITKLDFFRLSWLGSPDLAFYSLVFVSVWQSIGFFILLYMAGLRSISQDLIEASVIDGANIGKSFWYVKLPLLMPAITICTFFSVVNSIKQFDIIFTLTAGGPGSVTTNVLYNIYKDAFNYNLYGYATAKSLIVLAVVFLLTYFQLKILKSREIEA